MDTFSFSCLWTSIRRGGGVVTLFLPVIILLLSPSRVWAHSALDDYVHHRINLKADSNYIDISVELFFQAYRSEEERRLMDRDFDGHITSDEICEYLKHRTGQFKKGIQLSIDGHPLRVMTLYPAGLKLHNTNVIASQPHELRLYYFARASELLKPGSVLTLEDSLWKSAPAIYSLSVRGKCDCRLAIEDCSTSILSPQHFGGRRKMQVRCLTTLLSGTPDCPQGEKPAPDNDSSTSQEDRPTRKACDIPRNNCSRKDAATRGSGESQ